MTRFDFAYPVYKLRFVLPRFYCVLQMNRAFVESTYMLAFFQLSVEIGDALEQRMAWTCVQQGWLKDPTLSGFTLS